MWVSRGSGVVATEWRGDILSAMGSHVQFRHTTVARTQTVRGMPPTLGSMYNLNIT